ncbi:ABC transporter substrate-binding protein [Curtobacterium ammoniigenes]|uniref:ABC transporter substrate-binding protein n=1 Tax=Curtobacterium ammoniigenes TaxID=395387 RepID=UPI00082D8F29|nr:ABC transporter substrate-binding protein [Curtobacterium ammoniigenes]
MILDRVQQRRPARRRARFAAIGIGLVASALALAGCSSPGGTGSGAASATPTNGGTLTYASGDAEPTCLDPHVGGNYPQALLASQYIQELVSMGNDRVAHPALATSWSTSADGLTWTFHLRTGVQFSDGTPFDAAAVVRNVQHVQDPTTASSTGYLALGAIATATATDAHTVTFTLSRPDSALLESLSQPWVGIESPKALARTQAANCAAPVGTGPFIVTSWKHGDRITLERNAHYTPLGSGDARPHLASIVWRFIPDSTSRYAALQSGQVDVIDNPQPDQVHAARANGPITVLNAPRPGASDRLELNSGHGVFTDPAVRKAFIAAADINPGIASLYLGTVHRSYSVLSSVEPDAYADKSLFGYDPATANALLDAAGWKRSGTGVRMKNGQPLSVTFPVSTNQSIPAEQSLFQQIQASEQQVGFQVHIEDLDLSSWYAALAANKYDVVSAPYTKVGPDVLRILYDSASIKPAPSGYFANLAQLDEPALDSLLQRADATADPTARAALYKQAQQLILSSHTVLPLYDQRNEFLVRSSVHGISTTSVSTPEFGSAWISR